jgi:3-methyl-2-oxobutanoate hydroxymethyltransferase
MVTAYDYTAARLVDQAGIPMILVGDSIGQTMLGYENTLPVTLDDIIRATAAVVRGAGDALVVADMPFMTYQVSDEDALRNAGRLIKEGGAHAVKLEGGLPIAGLVRKLDNAGIAVMGHLGLTPQSVHKLGGYSVQGKTSSAASKIIDEALALEDAGAFSIVLELVPVELAEQITNRLSIPTIGIGSGIACDGQVQVLHDILGLSLDFVPRHAKQYAQAGDVIRAALTDYCQEVQDSQFPGEAQTVHSKRLASLDNVTELDVANGS